MDSIKRIACWMSDKKIQKINWIEFENACRSHGYELFKLNLNESFESQEPFCVLLHKLTDIIASANQGDTISTTVIQRLETYLANNPSVIVIDPIIQLRQLLDRYKTYSIIKETNLDKYGVFTPTFCEINSTEKQIIVEQLKASSVNYPFICKPAVGHGSKAHALSIIFNENGLIDCKAPCVAQSFVNHNAVLYKIFIVGEKFYFVERPSLKNFKADELRKTIFFHSSDVSKAGSQSCLSILDPEDSSSEKLQPDYSIMELIALTLRNAFKMDLLGVDIVIDNFTKKYAIIDVNAYPGYDGFPDFFNALLKCINNKIEAKQ